MPGGSTNSYLMKGRLQLGANGGPMNVVRKLHHYLVLPHPGTRESICIYFNFVLDPWFGSGAPPLEGMIPGPTGSSERVASVIFAVQVWIHHPTLWSPSEMLCAWRLLRLSLKSGGIRTLSPSSFVYSMTNSCRCPLLSI